MQREVVDKIDSGIFGKLKAGAPMGRSKNHAGKPWGANQSPGLFYEVTATNVYSGKLQFFEIGLRFEEATYIMGGEYSMEFIPSMAFHITTMLVQILPIIFIALVIWFVIKIIHIDRNVKELLKKMGN